MRWISEERAFTVEAYFLSGMFCGRNPTRLLESIWFNPASPCPVPEINYYVGYYIPLETVAEAAIIF